MTTFCLGGRIVNQSMHYPIVFSTTIPLTRPADQPTKHQSISQISQHFPTNKTSLFIINLTHLSKDTLFIHLLIISHIPNWSIYSISQIFEIQYGCKCPVCTRFALSFLTYDHGLRGLTDYVSNLNPHLFHASSRMPKSLLHPHHSFYCTSFFMLPATCLVLFIHPMPHVTCLIPRGLWVMP